MEQKKLFGDYIKPVIFTMLLLIFGSVVLYQQGYFSKGQVVSPMIFGDMEIKVVFEDGKPELVAYIPQSKLSMIPSVMGDPVPLGDSMVLGYYEGKYMSEENKISGEQAIFGFEVNEEFLGGKAFVTGMLRKTDTIIDMMHILPKDRFDAIQPAEEIDVKFTEDRMPKFFYYIEPDSTNWPNGINFSMGGLAEYEQMKNESTIVTLNIGGLDLHINQNKTYLPLVLGSEEAKMMMDEGLFSKTGDKLEGFFGKNVVIAGVLKPTGTVLDMFHYMPAE
jgi:hypothetical protein